MGLAVRAFVAPGDLRARDARHVSDVRISRRRLRRKTRRCGRIATTARRIATPCSRSARRDAPPVVYLANPDNPSGRFMREIEIAEFCRSAFRRFAAAARRSVRGFRRRRRAARRRCSTTASCVCGRFPRPTVWRARESATRVTTERNVRTFQKIRLHYGINRNAQVGALASLADEEFRRYVVRETAAAREEYYALARELGRGYIESRTNFVCIEMETAQRARRVMDELLARGVWIRKPGAPPLDAYVRVSAGTEPMREAFAAALRDVLAEVFV